MCTAKHKDKPSGLDRSVAYDGGQYMPQSTPTTKIPTTAGGGLWWGGLTLCHRELIGYFRSRGRLFSALVTPALFWLMLGSGLNQAFSNSPQVAQGLQIGYRQYFFPGSMVMIVMFTAIFASYSVIDERNNGFLQGVLAAPIPRTSIVLGKVLGGALIATLQALVFMLAWPVMGHWSGWLSMSAAAGMLLVIAVALTVIGFALAWPMDSTAGFHARLNLIYFPMWFLSGAVFPYDSVPLWLKILMAVNPLTYGQTALAALMHGSNETASGPVNATCAAAIFMVFTILLLIATAKQVARPRSDGLL